MIHQHPVNANQVAEHFGVTVETVRRWVRERRIPCIWISRRVVRFHIPDVERALLVRASEPLDGKGKPC